MKTIARIIGMYLNVLALIAPKLAAKQAFYVFCYPFAAKLKPHQSAFLDSGSTSTIDFEGKLIMTYAWGSGPETILCLHGWQSHSFRWKKFIASADKEKYTILAIDAPGHGKSEGRILNVPIYARLVAQVMESHAIDHIVGHSIGCFAALHAMHEVTTERPRSIACLAAPGSAEEFFQYFNELVRISTRLEHHLRVFFKSFTGYDVSYFETDRYASNIDVPALIIHDRYDDEVPLRYAERLQAAWPSSELVVTEGFGHKMRDSSVVEMVKEFLNSNSNEKEHHGELTNKSSMSMTKLPE